MKQEVRDLVKQARDNLEQVNVLLHNEHVHDNPQQARVDGWNEACIDVALRALNEALG